MAKVDANTVVFTVLRDLYSISYLITVGIVKNHLYKYDIFLLNKIRIVTTSKEEACNQIADKYIEFEPIIILLDLLLLSQPAFRHVMFNTRFKIYAKILVVQLLFESYVIWIDAPKPPNELEYASEKEFYFSFILTAIDFMLLVLTFQLWTKVTKESSSGLGIIHLVKAMTLSKIAKFFMIPIVIWSKNAGDSASLRLVLVNGYYFLSLTHVLSVLTKCSRKTAAVMTLLTIIVKHIVMVELSQWLRDVVMI